MRFLFIICLVLVSTNIFAFESERLYFRSAELQDLDNIMGCIESEEDFHFILPPSFKKESARALYQRRIEHPHNEYLFVAEDKSSKEFIGYCGISEHYVFEKQAAKFYFAVSPQKRKLGYGFEIEQRMIDYVRTELKRFEIFLHTCVPANLSSIQIAKKLGFIHFGTDEEEEDDPEEIYVLSLRS